MNPATIEIFIRLGLTLIGEAVSLAQKWGQPVDPVTVAEMQAAIDRLRTRVPLPEAPANG